MATLEMECRSCNGSGVYRGFAEPPGVAVVCQNCDGTGCSKLNYTPFTGRKNREGVREVCRSRGTFIATGIGPMGNSVTYQEFCNGKLPR